MTSVDYCPACRWTADALPSRLQCPECETYWPLRRGVSRDYAALGWTPGALSHDFGGAEDRAAVACYWPPSWRDVAREIMRLPVTVRDEPTACAGACA